MIRCCFKAVEQFSSTAVSADYAEIIQKWQHSNDGSNVIHQLSSIFVKLFKLIFSKRRNGSCAWFYAMRFVIKVRYKLLSGSVKLYALFLMSERRWCNFSTSGCPSDLSVAISLKIVRFGFPSVSSGSSNLDTPTEM